MTAPDTPDTPGGGFSARYAAYRAHLDTCPRQHLGLLANCPEGARLRALWTGDDWPADRQAGRLGEASTDA
ncbi:hypothetical protein AB0I84_47945 [Streptomyces spectabilis]|uniref:hypothetical protein n=1 Tax=Streptomyces spectabilis TaxID=68270 RepID=UPI003401A36D